jgi:hypothetical protein
MSEIKYCKGCGEEIPAGRIKALPNTITCVNCSGTGMKRGVPVQLGEGDHTCTELVIMEEKEYMRYIGKASKAANAFSSLQSQEMESNSVPNISNLDLSNIENTDLSE